MPHILDGKKIAQKLKDQLKIEIENIKIKSKRVPGLAVIQVGNVAASSVYVKAKTKAAKEVGINVFDHHLEETRDQNDLINLISQLNSNGVVDGMVVVVAKHVALHDAKVTRVKETDALASPVGSFTALSLRGFVACAMPHSIVVLIDLL